MTGHSSSPVTDAMVERAWAAIVGTDVAGLCFQASIIRGDLRTALEAVIGPAQRHGAEFDQIALCVANQIEAIPTDWPLTRRKAHTQVLIIDAMQSLTGFAQAGQQPVGWFYHNDYHGYQQVAKEFEGEEGQIPLYADAAQTATREALEEINALISNGDRPTVNERNAFEHFTALNRLLLNIRDIARRALSSVPSPDKAPIDPCPKCGSSMDGGPIPENIRKHYSPPYRWSRKIGISDRDEDALVAWECPDCKGRWPVTSKTQAPRSGWCPYCLATGEHAHTSSCPASQQLHSGEK